MSKDADTNNDEEFLNYFGQLIKSGQARIRMISEAKDNITKLFNR